MEISVEEAIELRKKAEKEINKVIRSFEERTGARVEGIKREQSSGNIMPYVELEVKI